MKYKERKCLVVRRIGNSLRDSVFALFKSTISDWGLYDACKINKTDLTIELPNGSQFLFKGLDDEERLKSIANIDDIWVEEATELDDFKFDQLCLRLRSKNPYNQVFVSFNPVSKQNWVYKRWFEDGGTYNKDNTSVLKTTYKDNRFLPQSYIDNLMDMKKSNPAYFEIYANGEFCSLEKLVYTNWRVELFDYREILKSYPKSKALFALDFGYVNDPTAFTGIIVDDESRKLWVFDEFFEKGLLNNEIAARIKEKGYAKEVITCDSAEQKSIAELKTYGINRARPAVKGRDSIINGVQLVQQYEMIVHPCCPRIKEELENYAWTKDKKTGEYINTPIDKWNHGLDSIRYSLQTEYKSAPAKINLFERHLLF